MKLHETRKQCRDYFRLICDENNISNWTITFKFRGKMSLGQTVYKIKEVQISKYLIARGNMEQLKQVILHEIAHIMAPGDGHGEVWRQQCVKLGYYGDKYAPATFELPSKWSFTCVCPGRIGRRHVKRWSAAKCKKCNTIVKWTKHF